MWILLIPLIVAEVAFWLFLLFAAWRAFKALRESRLPAMACWLAVIAMPFVVYVTLRTQAEVREAARAREVASLPREQFPADHPRLLEIHGFVTDAELLMFLDALDLDEIVMLQSRPHRGIQRSQHFTLAAGCRGRGREHLANLIAKGRLADANKADKQCLQQRQGTVDADRRDIAAIRFLLGTATTLRIPGNSWSAGNYEARLHTPGQDMLLDYWERPYITRPGGPSPWSYAYPANTDWKSYRSPGRAKFFARAVGLLPPMTPKTAERYRPTASDGPGAVR